MNSASDKADPASRKRRYLVHLFCAHDKNHEACSYVARIQPWSASIPAPDESHERIFINEWELIETINPLLTPGSDVRDVLSLIESPDGFLYLLHLSLEEAAHLGWRA